MILNVQKPVEEWFDLPSYGEIQKRYTVRRFEGSTPEQFLVALYELSARPDDGLLVPREFEILPSEIVIQGKTIEVDTANKFKRFGWYVQLRADAGDPREQIIDALSWKAYNSNVVGYSWRTGQVRKLVPFLSMIEGLEYLAINTGPIAEEVHTRTGVTFNPNRPRIYQDSLDWRLPSRKKETTQAHLTKLTGLPFQNSGNEWYDLDFEHTCEDAFYKFKSRPERGIRYFCDHLVAAYRIAQLAAPSDNPIAVSPFPVVNEGLVELDDIMRYRMIREHADGRKDILNEAERNKIFGWLVANYRRGQNVERMFRRDGFEGLDWNRVVKFV